MLSLLPEAHPKRFVCSAAKLRLGAPKAERDNQKLLSDYRHSWNDLSNEMTISFEVASLVS